MKKYYPENESAENFEEERELQGMIKTPTPSPSIHEEGKLKPDHLIFFYGYCENFNGVNYLSKDNFIEYAERLNADKKELFQMVIDLKNCIKRLTADDLTQYDKDTEAQWEGEAHELLTRINPKYYKNANEK